MTLTNVRGCELEQRSGADLEAAAGQAQRSLQRVGFDLDDDTAPVHGVHPLGIGDVRSHDDETLREQGRVVRLGQRQGEGGLGGLQGLEVMLVTQEVLGLTGKPFPFANRITAHRRRRQPPASCGSAPAADRPVPGCLLPSIAR